nr:immunoglobulin light chain junction region [Mus musculus]NSL99585.1 immunoglobulin light chain junction region [Mus musculus]
CQQHNEYPFTF